MLIMYFSGTKPMHQKGTIKILAIEDLKNDTKVASIKKELSLQAAFYKKNTAEITRPEMKSRAVAAASANQSCEILPDNNATVPTNIADSAQTTQSAKRTGRGRNSVSAERMKLFLSMNRKDVTVKAARRTFACERDMSEIKVPVDTLRCPQCKVLYERVNHAAHERQCTGKDQKTATTFGCTKCHFRSCDLAELKDHIREKHMLKK